jgi:hypothetical protein
LLPAEVALVALVAAGVPAVGTGSVTVLLARTA